MLDPFFSAKAHAKRLKRLAETNLTIHMLTSKESLSGQYQNQDSYSHYDLAYAIAKEGYSMTTSSQQRHMYYETALGEYYLLLKRDFYYSGALESVILLLAVLGYDNHCLALLNYVLIFLEDHDEDRIPNHATMSENEEPMEWVYGMPPPDNYWHNFEDRLGVLQKQQQWCANSFLVPLFLITLRKQKGNETDFYLEKGARLGKRIEEECLVYQLPVLRSWSVKAHRHWGPKQARILLAPSSMIITTTTMDDPQQPNRWKESCLVFWNILRDVVHTNDDLNDSLTNTMQYMEMTLDCPPVSDEPPKATSWRDLFSPSHVSSGNLYCLQCRKRLRLAANSSSNTSTNWFGDDVPEDNNLPKALRCSRSRVMYYCSTDCQRKNFKLTKRRGKRIHELRSGLSDEGDETTVVANKTELRRRYDLACAIVDLAYVSTDTIERGKHMYHLALLEYYQVLRMDFYFVGALESVLLLLCILGYDNHLLGLIDFVFYQLEQFPKEPISIPGKNGQEDDPRLMEWAQGNQPLERKSLVTNLEQISLLKGTQWCPSNFLVPLFFWSLKAQTQNRDSASSFHLQLQTSANIGKLIECSLGSYLPFIRALFPDSRQSWCRDEAAELLVLSRIPDLENRSKNSTIERLPDQSETEHWENECLQFWQLLKEAVAFTPNLTTALEDTISYMEEHLQYVPFAEETSPENATEDMEGFAAWAKNMSELESKGKLERVFPS